MHHLHEFSVITKNSLPSGFEASPSLTTDQHMRLSLSMMSPIRFDRSLYISFIPFFIPVIKATIFHIFAHQPTFDCCPDWLREIEEYASPKVHCHHLPMYLHRCYHCPHHQHHHHQRQHYQHHHHHHHHHQHHQHHPRCCEC